MYSNGGFSQIFDGLEKNVILTTILSGPVPAGEQCDDDWQEFQNIGMYGYTESYPSDSTPFPSKDAAKKRCLELNDCGGFVEENGDYFLRTDTNCLFDSTKYKTFIRPRPCSAKTPNPGLGSNI